MEAFFKGLKLLFVSCRGYSTPTSFMSCLVPFVFCALSGGNIKYGMLAFLGVLTLHLGVNIFDDIIDYIREIKDINNGKKNTYNFQDGKCAYIINGDISLKASFFIAFALFLTALVIGIYFLFICGLKLLWIILPTMLLCLFYPILGCFGLGEIIVGLIYSVLLFSGMSFVMLGVFYKPILLLSVSTGLLVVNVLYNHMLLDFKVDTTNRKITLCRLCGTEKKALLLQAIIISLAYINIVVLCILKILPNIYLMELLTLPYAF
ncbi:prenyltransferase, partial [bacterium]|nr:prenyltransferase [bacterium]